MYNLPSEFYTFYKMIMTITELNSMKYAFKIISGAILLMGFLIEATSLEGILAVS